VLEQFVHALMQVLDVLVGVVGECVARSASPDQLLGPAIEEINNHGTNLVCIGCGRRLAKTSAAKASPTPPASEPVVKSIQGLLTACDLHGNDGNIAARIHLGPPFRC
jgi:hypothetical protein